MFYMKQLKLARGYVGQNAVNITMKMKTIFPIHLMIEIIKYHLRNFDIYIYHIHRYFILYPLYISYLTYNFISIYLF